MTERINEILKKTANAHLAVVDEQGYPVVMVMSVINPENLNEVYMSTTLDSNKSKYLQKNNKASVCINTKENNITLVGEAQILTDQETKSKCWQNWFISHYKDGETDPNYCIIKFNTKRVAAFVDGQSAAFEV